MQESNLRRWYPIRLSSRAESGLDVPICVLCGRRFRPLTQCCITNHSSRRRASAPVCCCGSAARSLLSLAFGDRRFPLIRYAKVWGQSGAHDTSSCCSSSVRVCPSSHLQAASTPALYSFDASEPGGRADGDSPVSRVVSTMLWL